VGERTLDRTAYFEDQLLYTLRALPFAEGLTSTIALYPTVVTVKAELADPVQATLRVAADQTDTTSVENGAFHTQLPCWRVDVMVREQTVGQYWFSKDHPHVLYKAAWSDGRAMVLTSLRRSAYWQH
jgi:hypothetical protein